MGNLALKKPTKASPISKPETKNTNANDGDVTTPGQHYGSQTVEDPFWRVDLLDVFLVITVEIVCRLDGNFDTNDVVEVRVGK